MDGHTEGRTEVGLPIFLAKGGFEPSAPGAPL